MTDRPRATGLKWRPRKDGDVPYWFAPKEAVAKGFAPKSVRLHADDPRELVGRCDRLNAEAAMFLRGNTAISFDYTFGTLFDRYLSDPESTYHALKPSSRHPYTIYARKLKEHLGAVRIDMSDGRDAKRWFRLWAGVDDLKDPRAHLPRARMMLCVLKAAVAFGVICRLPACKDFSDVLGAMEFPAPKSRRFAPTAAQIEAARQAAHAAGAPSRALAYALQFETTLRQWDVIGIWVPLSDPRPSSIIDRGEKWIGPTWAMVDKTLVLRLTYGKTEDTSGLSGAYDLSACPMVVAELAHVTERSGPLIVNERTGLPYRYEGAKSGFKEGWKADFAAAGLDPGMWNRDLRAGAITEAGIHGANPDDMRKIAGHTTGRMVAQVYDRDTLEAHRRAAALRTAGRKANDADPA